MSQGRDQDRKGARLELDHLVVAAGRLDEGVAHVEAALGVTMSPGGRHDFMGTHNALLSLGPSAYLEVIAIDPQADAPPRPRWFGLDGVSGPPRLTNWVCRSGDLERDIQLAPDWCGEIVDAARGGLRWRMAVPDAGQYPLDGAFPGLISWVSERHPAAVLPDRGVRLEMLEICCPDAAVPQSALAGMLDMDKIRVVQGEVTQLTATLRMGDEVLCLS